MQVFKNKDFQKWSKKQSIRDDDLLEAIKEMNNGLYEANLGGDVYKKRLAYGNKGKRGGVRTILAFRVQKKAFFIYGFSKSKRDNITQKELEALKELSTIYLHFTEKEIKTAISAGELVEVKDEKVHS